MKLSCVIWFFRIEKNAPTGIHWCLLNAFETKFQLSVQLNDEQSFSTVIIAMWEKAMLISSVNSGCLDSLDHLNFKGRWKMDYSDKIFLITIPWTLLWKSGSPSIVQTLTKCIMQFFPMETKMYKLMVEIVRRKLYL